MTQAALNTRSRSRSFRDGSSRSSTRWTRRCTAGAFNPTIAEAHDACHGIYHAHAGDTLVQGTSGLADLRREHVVRRAAGDRDAPRATEVRATATCTSSTTPTPARHAPQRLQARATAVPRRARLLLAGIGGPLQRRGRQRARQLQPGGAREPPGRCPAAAGQARRRWRHRARTSSTSSARSGARPTTRTATSAQLSALALGARRLRAARRLRRLCGGAGAGPADGGGGPPDACVHLRAGRRHLPREDHLDNDGVGTRRSASRSRSRSTATACASISPAPGRPAPGR